MIYEQNVKYIINYNDWARNQGYDSRLGINAYSDLHSDEISYSMLDIKNLNDIEVLAESDTIMTRMKRATAPASWGLCFYCYFLISLLNL